MTADQIRLGADIGGTFTDIALDLRGEIISTKKLTDHSAPEQAIIDGMEVVTRQAGIKFGDLDLIVHGTTLATNALIERRGAKTAFITTDGFRDVLEMRTENRFDQYDLKLQLPEALIPRQQRYPIKGRIDAQGRVLQDLDEAAICELAKTLAKTDVESIAVGFVHSYKNPHHEEAARQIIAEFLPQTPISISSEVSPQMREYHRFTTVCANAYVRPTVERYLTSLESILEDRGVQCPLYMIHSAGGLISLDVAKQFPVRLVESGPAGGAIFAANISVRFGLNKVLSYDMGGTTAKICLIENHEPKTSRVFEVARTHRFAKGSGMPISIPVIEMIEIGAGGGSIATIDSTGRIQVGPHSASSEPGPACYQRNGVRPTVTDADLVLGKIDPGNFAGGAMQLSTEASVAAIANDIGDALELEPLDAAFGICEMVDENMANAARVHAVENGKRISENVMIAFGGAAPLHASRLCEKLGIDRCLIPKGAGVGSAIGFLEAPFCFESVISCVTRLSEFDPDAVNDLLSQLTEVVAQFVRQEQGRKTKTEMTAFMRYQGQGWEIPVPMPHRRYRKEDAAQIGSRFRQCYAEFFGRTIEELNEIEIEIVSWSVKITEEKPAPTKVDLIDGVEFETNGRVRQVYNPATKRMLESAIVDRDALSTGDRVRGPAVIVERETATIVLANFDAVIQHDRSILLIKNSAH